MQVKKNKWNISHVQIFNILIMMSGILMMQKFALLWLVVFSICSLLIIIYYPYRFYNLVLSLGGLGLIIGLWVLTTTNCNLKTLSVMLNNALGTFSLRNMMLVQTDGLYDERYSDFLKILLFNEKMYTNEYYLLFKDLGILHLLVVSGLHINVICMFFNWIFKKHYRLAIWINLCMCFLLFYFANFSISILRIIIGLVLLQFKPFKQLNAFERNCWVGVILCLFIRDASSYSFILTMVCTLAINFIIIITTHMLTRLFYINFLLFFVSLPITISFNGYFNIMGVLNGFMYNYVFLFMFYYSLIFAWFSELVYINSQMFNFLYIYFEQLSWLQYLFHMTIDDWLIALIYFVQYLGINWYFYKLNSNKHFWINYNKQYA